LKSPGLTPRLFFVSLGIGWHRTGGKLLC